MKPNHLHLLLGSTILAAAPFAHAASGNWNVNALGNWSTATNWSSNPTVPGTAAGDTIGFNNDINGARTVTIDANVSRTAAILNIGDSNNTHAFTIARTGTGILTLNNSGSPAQINETGSITDVISAPITLADNLAASVAGGLTLSGGISESGGAKTITKTGAGTLNLNGASNYTGVTNLNAGTTFVNNNTALGTSFGNTIVASGATAYIGAPLTAFAEALTITGTGATGMGAAFRIGGGGTSSMSGAVTLAGNATIITDGGLTFNLTGGIDTAGNALTLAPTGTAFNINSVGISGVNGSINTSGTVSLNAASSYTGGTTVTSGTLNIGTATTALGSTSGSLTVTAGTLNMASFNLTVGNLTGAGGIISGTAAGTRTLTIGQGDTGGGNFLGAINNGSGGTTALTKTGSGTIKLGSTSGYTGATAVSGGTLVVNGNISTSVSTTVSTGGTLAGTGTVGATTIQSTGILAPGDGGIESLNTSTLTLNAGSISNFQINATANTFDELIAATSLAFGGTLNVSNLGGNPDLGDSFDLFDFTSATGTFSFLILPTITGGNIWNTDNLYTTGTISVVVPEPSTALLGGLGLLAFLRRRR